MTAFEDLKSQWENQSNPGIPEGGAKKVLQKITAIKKKQQLTNGILSVTALVLIAFFVHISAHKFQTVMAGLLLMIGVLMARIFLEINSLRRLRKMNVSQDAEGFRNQMIRYYNDRKKVHFIFTPVIIFLYAIGFIMLLPSFKESLSEGFYSYILVSSVVVLVVLSVFIFKQIQKELEVLKQLKG